MGGKRVAEQVRRALILAAKVAPVAVVIDAAGCQANPCAYCPPEPNCGYEPFDTDAGIDAGDAGSDSPVSVVATDASGDGG